MLLGNNMNFIQEVLELRLFFHQNSIFNLAIFKWIFFFLHFEV